MYAIFTTGGKQYKVAKGDTIRVEKLDLEVGSKVSFDQVLLVSDKKVTVGSPFVAGAKVEATVKNQGKDKKVIVYKYKPKTGYHKKQGHRQLFTELEINNVVFGSKSEEKAEAADEAQA